MYGALAFQTISLVLVWVANHLRFPTAMTTLNLTGFLLTWGTAYGCFFALTSLRRTTMPRIGCWLGRISYSVYLLHPFVLLLVDSMPPWLRIAAFIPVTLVLGELSYRFVEAPCIAFGRAVEGRWWPVDRDASTMPMRRAA